jgi:cyclase
MSDQHSLGSRHFRLERLADGIWAAIHIDGGWAQSNAGIIDLGDRTLVFDTFINPEAATDLRAVALELTGRPAVTVINSHSHNDHMWGNQAFPPETDIISTTKTRELITAEWEEEYEWCREHSAQRLEQLQARLHEETDEAAWRLT